MSLNQLSLLAMASAAGCVFLLGLSIDGIRVGRPYSYLSLLGSAASAATTISWVLMYIEKATKKANSAPGRE